MINSGYLVIVIDCLNHGKLLAMLTSKGVELKSVKKEYKKLTLSVKERDEKTITEFLTTCGYQYRMITRKGLLPLWHRLLFRKGLLIGVVVSVIMLCICFNTVFSYTVIGADKTANSIETILFSKGLSSPRLKKQIITDDIKSEINRVEGIALCSVFIRGSMLFVEVNEELEKPITQKPEYIPIVAQSDCIITKIVVLRGTAMVKAGDSVKKGQVLIEPYYILGKEEGTTAPCEALGDVYGRVYYSKEQLYFEQRLVTNKTGRSEQAKSIYFGDNCIAPEYSSEFSDFIVEKTCIVMDILPIKIFVSTRYEVQSQTVYVPFETVQNQLVAELYSEICQDIKNNVQIINKWCIINKRAVDVSIRGIVETVQPVGIKRSG